MSVYRTLADLTPAQRRRFRLEKFGKVKWDVHTIMGEYQEPWPSEPRHHWVWLNTGPVVVCDYCDRTMLPRGDHPRMCIRKAPPS